VDHVYSNETATLIPGSLSCASFVVEESSSSQRQGRQRRESLEIKQRTESKIESSRLAKQIWPFYVIRDLSIVALNHVLVESNFAEDGQEMYQDGKRTCKVIELARLF